MLYDADYGGSFSDVIQGVEHTVENLSSDQITPSSFKYRIALEKQVMLLKPIPFKQYQFASMQQALFCIFGLKILAFIRRIISIKTFLH